MQQHKTPEFDGVAAASATVQKPSNTDAVIDRRTYIGGSDIGAICGVSPYKTAMDVYLDKVEVEPSQRTMSETMYWGVLLEASILAEWEARGCGTITKSQVHYEHPEFGWARGTADAIGIDSTGTAVLLEAKKIGDSAAREWSEGIPNHYLYQVQWYLCAAQLRRAEVCVLFSGSRWERYVVEADQGLQQHMLAQAKSFWERNVLCEIPPSPLKGAGVAEAGEPSIDIESVPGMLDNVQQMLDLKLQIKDLGEALESVEKQLKEASGGLALSLNGKVIASWKEVQRKGYTVAASVAWQFVWAQANKIRKIIQGDA